MTEQIRTIESTDSTVLVKINTNTLELLETKGIDLQQDSIAVKTLLEKDSLPKDARNLKATLNTIWDQTF